MSLPQTLIWEQQFNISIIFENMGLEEKQHVEISKVRNKFEMSKKSKFGNFKIVSRFLIWQPTKENWVSLSLFLSLSLSFSLSLSLLLFRSLEKETSTRTYSNRHLTTPYAPPHASRYFAEPGSVTKCAAGL